MFGGRDSNWERYLLLTGEISDMAMLADNSRTGESGLNISRSVVNHEAEDGLRTGPPGIQLFGLATP
jgi:hypothetical protein